MLQVLHPSEGATRMIIFMYDDASEKHRFYLVMENWKPAIARDGGPEGAGKGYTWIVPFFSCDKRGACGKCWACFTAEAGHDFNSCTTRLSPSKLAAIFNVGGNNRKTWAGAPRIPSDYQEGRCNTWIEKRDAAGSFRKKNGHPLIHLRTVYYGPSFFYPCWGTHLDISHGKIVEWNHFMTAGKKGKIDISVNEEESELVIQLAGHLDMKSMVVLQKYTAEFISGHGAGALVERQQPFSGELRTHHKLSGPFTDDDFGKVEEYDLKEWEEDDFDELEDDDFDELEENVFDGLDEHEFKEVDDDAFFYYFDTVAGDRNEHLYYNEKTM